MKVWDATDCGLVNKYCLTRLKELRIGTEESPTDKANEARSPADSPTRLIKPPAYVPYDSGQVPRYQSGEDSCRRFFDLVFCPEVQSSVRESPLATIIERVLASLRANLYHGSGNEGGISIVAALAPPKGGEAVELVSEYLRRHADSKEVCLPMIVRDFYASFHCWAFIRCTDGRVPDCCASLQCLATGVDYVGARDDPKAGGFDNYVAAAGEGVALLSGKAATQNLRDLLITGAFIAVKDAMGRRSKKVNFTDNTIPARLTPDMFLLARWWDGAMVPYIRCTMSTSDYKHLTDSLGTFTSCDMCGNIKRAMDNLIRYNEVVDAIPDYVNKESFNELLLALAMTGSNGVSGYGHALARAVDNALSCHCGVNGHEEASEISMGNCLGFLMNPRYAGARQLLTYSASTDELREAYAWLPPGQRLRAVAEVSLLPGNTLHTPEWQPVWNMTCDNIQEPLACELAQRIRRRSIVDGMVAECSTQPCEAVAISVLEECDRLDTPDSLRRLSSEWCRLFDTVLACTPAGKITDDSTIRGLSSLVGRIWQHIVVGPDCDQKSPIEETDVKLFIDTDRTIRQTFLLPPTEGIAVRRAFLGVATSALELSGLSPLARLTNGLAFMHNRYCMNLD